MCWEAYSCLFMHLNCLPVTAGPDHCFDTSTGALSDSQSRLRGAAYLSELTLRQIKA